MKKPFIFTITLLSSLLLINWSQDHTIEGRKKLKINFSGTLLTHTDKKYDVENITIGHMYKQIPVYEYPSKNDFDPQTGKFNFNPRDRTKRTITRIDLTEIAEIHIDPQTQWYFQRKGGRKVFFVPLTVISNNPQKTKNKYLIEASRTITVDHLIPDGKPIEMDVPPKAVRSLVIKGYKEQEKENGTKAKNKN